MYLSVSISMKHDIDSIALREHAADQLRCLRDQNPDIVKKLAAVLGEVRSYDYRAAAQQGVAHSIEAKLQELALRQLWGLLRLRTAEHTKGDTSGFVKILCH